MNPRIGHHDSGPKNAIGYYSYVRNQIRNTNMPMLLRKSAKIESLGFVFRGDFVMTYNAV